MTAEVNNRNQNDYFNPSLTAEQFYAKGGQYFMNNNIYTAPARITGEGNLQRKYINPVATPDKTWSYTPGQRRVRLSPDAAYDFPVATVGRRDAVRRDLRLLRQARPLRLEARRHEGDDHSVQRLQVPRGQAGRRADDRARRTPT